MTRRSFLHRNLAHYWRSNLAVIAGVATAVAVLAGALVVGDSVRASLRALALERIGNTESVVRSGLFFREALAAAFGQSAPLIVLEGLVTHQASGRRANKITIYGVDDRFWKFHQRRSPGLANREAAASSALAAELGSQPGDTLLARFEKPSDIPAESLFGRKEDAAPTVRFNLKSVLTAAEMGDFSLRPQQGVVRALFVPLSRLQLELGFEDRVNTILAGKSGAAPAQILRSAFALEDIGLRLRSLDDRRALQLDSASGILSDPIAAAARQAAARMDLKAIPLLTYMATSIKANGRELPYSLIAALDLSALGVNNAGDSTLLLNEWAARDLAARPGGQIEMQYMLWHEDGRLTTEKAEFTAGHVLRIAGLAADRDLTPEYPGITDADNVSDWDPPFPMDLGKIRPRDEDYWHIHGTTPKAFLTLNRAQQLWQSRWGKIGSLRLPVNARDPEGLDRILHEYRTLLRASLDPLAHGLAIVPLREQNLAASQGATDFGEYFSYFSFFLMVSALLLAGLFFRLSIEQRSSEIGLLRAVGFPPDQVRNLFLFEGLLLSLCGGVAGVLGAILYAALVLRGLGTWWVGAVGTRDLSLSLAPAPLLIGLAGGVAASALAILWTLRGIRDVTPRRLLAGGESAFTPKFESRASRVAIAAGALCAVLLGVSVAGVIPAAGGFFGVGILLLVAALAGFRAALAASIRRIIGGARGLAFRNAGYRPDRTILSAALIASATFLVVSVEAFRRDARPGELDPKSGTGGYPLMAESVRPLYHNLDTAEGRQELNLASLAGVSFVPIRLRPGDDSSCLNLYQPRNPRILGVPAAFIGQGRFAFAESEGEPANPWKLLERKRPDGAVPAIADANSITYVLHKKVGDDLVLPGGVRLRLVAALNDSIFQSEIVIAESEFLRLYPAEQGFREFLIQAPLSRVDEIVSQLESALSDHGFDAVSTAEKLATFHRVENTYLSTFQALGALGLLLGTVGLAAVIFRNVFERRRELALLTAVGYSRGSLARLVLYENLILLAAGLAIGIAAAALAITPAIASRGPQFSILGMLGLLAAVALTGVLATFLATRLALGGSLLNALRPG